MSNIEAEKTFLGIILAKPRYLMDVKLTPKHFRVDNHVLIMRSITNIEAMNKPVNVFAVVEELKKQTGRDFFDLLMSYANEDWRSGFFKSAQNVILENYKKSEIAKIAQELSKSFDPDTAISQLMDLEVTEKNYSHSISEAAIQALTNAQESAKKDGLTGLTTGFKELDTAFGGFQSPDLYVIGARPAMGKTSFILNLMLNNKEPVGFISTEQPMEQIGLRAISIKSGVSAMKIRTVNFANDDISKMTVGVNQLKQTELYIFDKSNLKITELMREARRMKYNHNIKAIYVDYIQRIKGSKSQDRRLEVAEVVTGLKTLARELEIPVIGLAQVNRSVEAKTDKRPHMGDLLESGVIEQEADVVMLLYRDEVYNLDSNDKGIIEVLIDKNRHGATGRLRLAWLPETMEVRDLVDNYNVPNEFH